MAAGKTKEFAQNILLYYASGEPLTPPTGAGLYVTLLSGIPTGAQPYDGSAVAEKEVLPGAYRAFLDNNKLTSAAITKTNNALSIENDGGTIDFGLAPVDLKVSGYAVVLDATSVSDNVYIAYETFENAPSKQRNVYQNDTIKINVGGLVIREK